MIRHIHTIKRVNGKDIKVIRTEEIKRKPRKEKKCKYCGCTQKKACPGGCYWIKPNICSKCAHKEKK